MDICKLPNLWVSDESFPGQANTRSETRANSEVCKLLYCCKDKREECSSRVCRCSKQSSHADIPRFLFKRCTASSVRLVLDCSKRICRHGKRCVGKSASSSQGNRCRCCAHAEKLRLHDYCDWTRSERMGRGESRKNHMSPRVC